MVDGIEGDAARQAGAMVLATVAIGLKGRETAGRELGEGAPDPAAVPRHATDERGARAGAA